MSQEKDMNITKYDDECHKTVDGQILNLERGFGEIFGWELSDGKPFYFFEQAGQVSLSYDVQSLPVQHNEVLHPLILFA
jgi:hypothetical protein